MSNQPIYVTNPTLPPINEFIDCIKDIWESKWLTNNGKYHQMLEKSLCEYLGVKYCSLFCNGTIALQAALAVLNISGEVITTPFTFLATANSIVLSGGKPVFVDIEPHTFNIDPKRVEEAITDKTTAIMPVHVYGNPCNISELERIAKKYNLKLIYDAAHAFGIEKDGASILNAGDVSMVSFHATKVFSTIEGGAIFTNDPQVKQNLDLYKNFGISSETTAEGIGTNGKMNEVQAAFGLLNLKYIDGNIQKRREVADIYRKAISQIDGVSCIEDLPGVRHNYGYFPIIVDETKYKMSRDELYEQLKASNIFSRRYFYPLITDFESYKSGGNYIVKDIPIAENIANRVLCLPMYSELEVEDIDKVIGVM